MDVSDKWGEEMSDDLIRREDAIKALRLEYPMMPLFKAMREEWALRTEGFRRAEEAIKKAPTIDAVSVVRCKECKWAKANGTYQWCGRLDSTARITADDFCSYGERREP